MIAKMGAVTLAAMLAGCGDATPAAQPTEAAATEIHSKSDKGTGTVTAVDPAAGSVTIDHGAMPQVGWSAMIMTFKADPALLANVAVGDKVAFDVTVTDGRGELTALAAE